MAIVKHIKSKNANYTDAINYLFYQHDEKTKTLLLNEYGQPMLREEFYADGLNCTPETFDLDCSGTNRTFNKNRRPGEIKSHHYIISYDPRDASDYGLTGEKAQANMILNVYSHILDDDRRKNAELFEKVFYEKKELNPDIHRQMPENMLQVPEGVNAELLEKVLANPEMAALLASMAKTLE